MPLLHSARFKTPGFLPETKGNDQSSARHEGVPERHDGARRQAEQLSGRALGWRAAARLARARVREPAARPARRRADRQPRPQHLRRHHAPASHRAGEGQGRAGSGPRGLQLMAKLDYFFRETTSGLRRNGLVAFAAISTTFIALLLFGLALLISRQVNIMIDRTTGNVEVAIYLSDPVNDQNVASLLGCEPGRGGYVCAAPGVETLVDQREFLDRLFAVTRVFRVGVLLVAIVMLVSAAVLIANTVRMGLFARRKEIGIMKLVGATNWRIRIPFLIEGLFESLIGAVAAILVLFALKVAFINPLNNSVQFVPWIVNRDVLAIVPWLLFAGVLVAIVAGLVGMRRFLDV